MRDAGRRLRANPTPAERRLWNALSNGQLDGLRFRRQHVVGTFVYDFYCPAHRLVVELDGAVHEDPDTAEHDVLRQEAIENTGRCVLRFRNEEVLRDLRGVLGRILAACRG